MEITIRVLAKSLMMGLCCQIYFETLLKRRSRKHRWIEDTILPAFTAGFLVIAWTPIPPYALQPVRLVVILALIVQLYFQVKILSNLALSVLFGSIYWLVAMVLDSVIYVLPGFWYQRMLQMEEELSILIQLFLLLLFRHVWKKHMREVPETGWMRFGFLPLISLVVVMAFTMLLGDGGSADKNVILAASLGLGILNVFLVAFAGSIMSQEARLQRFQLLQERTQSQMELYRNMSKSYEQQRRYLHDYKNQLGCIQGLLLDGKIKEASDYIGKLTGNLKKTVDTVNTSHAVVNVVLNQKYREACEKGITIVMAVNNLSGLTVGEEDLVVLLVNLLDNAIEACERLEDHRVIQFKMMLEQGELVLSVRNPVIEDVVIRGKSVETTKKGKLEHGIGLLNVDEVVKRNQGTSALQCRDGWFSVSVVLPQEECG